MAMTPMKRIPRDKMPADLIAIRDRLDDLTGEPAFVEVFANAPELVDFVMNRFYGEIFFAGRVPNRYKQLVRLYHSQIHGCRTCNKQNIPASLEAGIGQAKVDAITTFETGPFDDAEKAVLRFAHQMLLTNHKGRMNDNLYADLKAHFDDAEICELGTVMAVIAGMAKLSFVLDLVEREDYCEFAPQAAEG